MSREVLCLLIGNAVLWGITLYIGASLFYAKKRVCSTMGVIRHIFYTSAKHFTSQSMATMGYVVDGKYYVSENRIYVFRTSKVGDRLSVNYFTHKPERLLTKSSNQFLFFLFMSVLCTFITIIQGVQ